MGRNMHSCLPDLQRQYCQYSKDKGDYTESQHNLYLVMLGFTSFENKCACRIIFQHIINRFTEMVVNRSALPYSHMTSTFLIEFIYTSLNNDANTLHQKHSAKQRQHQFFMNGHRTYTNDTTDGQASRIPKKNLCRESIPPQITHQCPYKCRKKNHNLF